MKIVHLILTRRFAGSERYAVELANLQQAAGHDVSIMLHRHAAGDRPDAVARHLEPGVKVILLSNFRPLALLQARRILKKLRPDVSHAHLSWACRILRGLPEAGLRVASLHIHYKASQHAGLDALIAIASWQLAMIPADFRGICTQIDNWSIAKEPHVDARQSLRRQYGFAEDTLIFGSLGRLEDSKGLDVLIRAFAKADIANARLVIVGDGKARPRLQAMAGKQVLFTGYSAQARDWLACFDVFVSAARSEPFGLVFLEAMHAGLPIIASASQGARHLAREIGSPLLPVADVDALCAALQQAASAKPARRTYAMQRFNATDRAEEITEFYRRCLQEQQQRLSQ